MLQIQSSEFNICRISKLIAKHNVSAKISNQMITLEGYISEELLSEICANISINKVQNYIASEEYIFNGKNDMQDNKTEKDEGQISVNDNKTDEGECQISVKDNKTEEDKCKDNVKEKETREQNQYPTVMYHYVQRGEVYYCDFGDSIGSEKKKIRPAIIVQSDKINVHTGTTIVIPCTSNTKKSALPSNLKFDFYSNMVSYNSRYKLKESCAEGTQLRTIDKSRLKSYIGVMKPEFMDELQKVIDFTLSLKRFKKVVNKISHVKDKIFISRINIIQVRLLSFVNIDALFNISESLNTDQEKVEKILELFGFDSEKTGVSYLLQAILISIQNSYFNLETLCEKISNNVLIDKEEIKRLIVARTKERFGLKKSPAIDFIRLVNSLITQKEELL